MVTFMSFPLNGTSRMGSKFKVQNESEYLSRIPMKMMDANDQILMKMNVNIDGNLMNMIITLIVWT